MTARLRCWLVGHEFRFAEIGSHVWTWCGRCGYVHEAIPLRAVEDYGRAPDVRRVA